ncbi:FAD/NAD(P)-binding oxidoreductase [Pseudanabaena sp. PCC 6802]|uniref:NAD(P)/FAD-dependent oxidoreductase n=1 Tax=Pseudanabaena sp. PCC 6802 TaxID=118173 RepID=UPI000371CA9B|nr:FAD/NAD(P)-binding oxidoreductase [Pseudanabaena sp. PCC 6802]
MTETNTYDIVIVGGGAAGISVAARIRNRNDSLAIAIIEPSDKHYYQPLWTLVGGGVTRFSETERDEASQIPKGVKWIKDFATGFDPDANQVLTQSTGAVKYKYLVVCPGIQIDWGKIEGLPESLGKNGVCSNYSKDTVERTWDFIKDFKGGTAIFTFPSTPIKCAGAPQKIMYLAENFFRKQGVRDKAQIVFVSAVGKIFSVEKYANALSKIIAERNIKTMFGYNLEKVDGENKKAWFRNLATNELLAMEFDLLHVGPPMSAPDFIKNSPLANQAGWVDVDKFTTQHVRFKNVFSLGDASSLPTSKTAAAVRKQAPVLVDRLFAEIDRQTSQTTYNGYTCCPLVTGYGKTIMAEFDYDLKPTETFPFDQGKERLSMYLLKKYGFPILYWNGMLKGTF